ncbi:MAG TPA: hypothetical protein VEL76_27520 [Gemmataceae bacterium]|nr:hypothetical protein [Gemmataceae bacterium]
MTEFEKALQETLKGINKAFEVADADLHEEAAAASKAVANVTDGKATLELVVVGESEGGITYDLTLTAGEQKWPLLRVEVPRKGYPINMGSSSIPNRQKLAGTFADMATNPDSPLVTNLAFLLRRQGATAAG